MRRTAPTGSAHTGLGEWLMQRVTALYLAGFLVYLVLYFAIAAPADHAAWRAWFAHGGVRLAWALCVAATLLHAWVGLRSVYMDYLRAPWLRFSLSALTALGLLAAALWAGAILLRVPA